LGNEEYGVVIKGTYAKEFLHEKGGTSMVNRCSYVFLARYATML
jgi:hypothetical protein